LHFRVPKSKYDKIGDDYEVLANNKQGIKFVNDKLTALGEKQTKLLDEYQTMQNDIVKELIESVNAYVPLLDDASELIACLDVLLGFSKASAQAGTQWVKPEIVKQGINLKASRHPLLEAQSTNVIPNDFEIDKKSFCVLSGANMGGKSTYMRQIGIICILTQMGCYVPCESAQVSIKDAIYSRVGAIDYLQRGLSTFMVEMIETNQILSNATNQSLVIIDELGRGTSTFDGYGLAFAISEYIINKIGSQCIFATHFHELSHLSEKYPNLVFNLHVKHLKSKNSHNEDEIIMLHKVSPGVCDESFGIHVAELAKFPNNVIKLARKRALELTQHSTKRSKQEDQSKWDKYSNFARMDLSNEKVYTHWIENIKK
jgi:DNA mismatch repair protein MSH2